MLVDPALCRYNAPVPRFQTETVLNLWRDLKVHLSFQAGISRDQSPAERPSEKSDEYGLNLTSGDRHYRAWVGSPDEYDHIAALQVSLRLAAGLRETHRLADVGCGSLRAGRMLIPYLRSGRYYGVEPERWLVEEGIKRELGREILEVKRPTFLFVSDFSLGQFGEKFDFVIAQSVFSHTHVDLLRLGLGRIAESLAPGGRFLATWAEGSSRREGSGWIHKGARRYTWEEMQGFLQESGLTARRLAWPHPRQSWFVAAHPEASEEMQSLAQELHNPRDGWGKKRRIDRAIEGRT